MLQHKDMDEFELVNTPHGNIRMHHIACDTVVVATPEGYLSLFSRQAEQHLKVCSVVNSQGQHAAPF